VGLLQVLISAVQVKEGDRIDLDQVLSFPDKTSAVKTGEEQRLVPQEDHHGSDVQSSLTTRTRRSRVEVVSIGAPTRKGGSHVTLKRIKEFCYVISS
jgi:hypothetical protein